MEMFSQVKGFEWDQGNISKNWERHKVTHLECEEIFFNEPLIVQQDKTHSTSEERHFALGKTDRGRVLFVVFTIRGDRIRVISARDASKKERRYYR
jgi:uncharacterized DUF497 family protein